MRNTEREARFALVIVAVCATAFGGVLALNFGMRGAPLVVPIVGGIVLLIAAGLWNEARLGPAFEWLLPLRGRWARTLVALVGLVLLVGVLALAQVFGPRPVR